jgi:hypothetical protein
MTDIDIRGGRAFIAVCPACGTTRYLPENWRQLMLDRMSPREQAEWDGALRCNGFGDHFGDPPKHDFPEEMIITRF